MFDPSTLLRPHIFTLEAYQPIQPFEVLSERLGLPASQIVKLDANENPYGPVPGVVEALAEYAYYHIYPDPQQTELRARISEYIDVPSSHILSAHGADELLDYLCRLFLQPGDAIINCPPTFGMYGVDAQLEEGRVIDVWRQPDHSVDVDAVIQTFQQNSAVKLLFLTSPNNPSGTWLSDRDLRALLELPLMLVLDEAYIEFADHPSRSSWVLQHQNLAVLRTFSKAAGIAGLRLGYGIFPTWLMDALWKFKQPYNVNVAASVAGIASLRHIEELLTVVEKLKAERRRLYSQLKTVPFLRPYPTQSNFVLCDVIGRSGTDLKAALERQGVLVRYYDKPGLHNCIRISVGRPDQTARLLEALALTA